MKVLAGVFAHRVRVANGLDSRKGVIVEVLKDEDMPVDQWGRRADLVLDGDSTIKRMNMGRLYEHWTNALSWHVRQTVLALLDSGNLQGAWRYICNYYKAGYPEHWTMMTEYLEQERQKGRYDEAVQYHLDCIRKSEIVRFLPPNSSVAGAEQIRRLKAVGFRPPKSPVTYRGNSGKMVKTIRKVLIGSMYIIVLEKTGDDWSSVSSPRLQHFGIPAKLSRLDKQSTPGHESPVRFLGEDEARLLAAACGGDTVAELLDMTNAPQVHKHVVRNILTAGTPTNIVKVRDMQQAPHGNNRALGFVKHLVRCGGARYVFPEEGGK